MNLDSQHAAVFQQRQGIIGGYLLGRYWQFRVFDPYAPRKMAFAVSRLFI